jgi:hypothetical protein
MKKPDVYLKEYCQRLSDENLKFLVGRLNQRLGGDLAEVLDFLSNVREIDRWLSSAYASFDLYDMIDAIHSSVAKEHDRRCNNSSRS